MTKVSVIVPVYKVPLEYLRTCLNSLTAQTLQECEFIVVSDGAPEAECSICEEYAQKDVRFFFFRREHAGVSAARNFGIGKANGEYITFVDSDDQIGNTCCQETYDFAKSNDSDIVLFDYCPVNSQIENSPFAEKNYSILEPDVINEIKRQTFRLNDLKYLAAVSTCCKLIKKELISSHSILFSPSIQIAEDRPFSFALFLHAKKISYLNKVFYFYTRNESSATHTFIPDLAPLLLKHLVEIKKISNEYNGEIGKEALGVFYSTWKTCYLNKKNKISLRERVLKLSKVVKSADFQTLISNVNSKGLPLITRFELLLMKKQITFFIWPHALKWKILNKAQRNM